MIAGVEGRFISNFYRILCTAGSDKTVASAICWGGHNFSGNRRYVHRELTFHCLLLLPLDGSIPGPRAAHDGGGLMEGGSEVERCCAGEARADSVCE